MMIKMIRATDKGHWHITLEEDILLEAKISPFLSMIHDEATNSGQQEMIAESILQYSLNIHSTVMCSINIGLGKIVM